MRRIYQSGNPMSMTHGAINPMDATDAYFWKYRRGEIKEKKMNWKPWLIALAVNALLFGMLAYGIMHNCRWEDVC